MADNTRRNFINTLGIMSSALVYTGRVPQYFAGINFDSKIDSVSLYLVNVEKSRDFSHSTWHNRQHIFVKIQSGKHIGWAESLANKNDLNFDFIKWGAFLRELEGMTISEGIEYTRDKFLSGKWNAKKSEPVLIAFYDLVGKIADKPTIELWGLNKREPVPGLFCILERDVDQALVQAEIAKQQNLTSHVKVKMFGDIDIDMALTVALRKSFGKDTFLMADANRGYKEWGNLDDLATRMGDLHMAGLDAMEDPAELSVPQWITLQEKVGDFALIPDRPMRPAHKAVSLFDPDMGKYFNIHPDTMGTLKEAVQLGKKIKSNNRGLMIGDSSLVGPACTFWQQMAIGLGASWVEAIEKPQESTVFEECVEHMSTAINSKGKVEIINLRPGFGIEMDEVKLSSLSDAVAQIF
jgi:L-alanine-DL-glutamate epimerase-like enolase superfamily enzyme